MRYLLILLASLALAACGGGGGSSPSATPTATPTPTPTPTPAAANTTTVTFDAGPPALQQGANGYSAFNEPYVTITICAPGSTTNCATIDHIILDTGSIGLRVIQPVLAANPALLAALPTETDSTGNPVGECYQYVNSYAFGSVRLGDFSIAGEKVANMPMQVINDAGVFSGGSAPASCSAGGGTAINTVQDFGANGIIGIGTTATDCGSICAKAGNSGSAAIYYDCPATNCAHIIALASTTSAPFAQLPNPVAAFAKDNNGTVITVPSVPQAGEALVTGSVTFGIGTQTNNALTATTLLGLTTSNSQYGPGILSAKFNNIVYDESFVDSGSNDYYFNDASLPNCPSSGAFDGFYCPTAPTALAPIMTGTNGVNYTDNFILYNPNGVSNTANIAPGLGIDPALVTPPLPFTNSFDFGVPFFFGRTVFTAIEGTNAGSTAGPYVAF